ncbi:MAG: dipeptidase [Hyphomicrobiaceae bacterium]
MPLALSRRAALAGIAATLAGPRLACAEGRPVIPLGDMHAHLFFLGPRPASVQPLARNMAGGGATLVAWSLVGDLPWIRSSRGGLKQTGAPKPRAASAWLDRELVRVKGHLAEQKLKIVQSAADVERALKGEPHVVLAVEGASFLDDGIAGLQRAYDAGIRHVQLVHYVRNAIGDFQTEAPQHQGLTTFGREVVRECNRLGILVDLAHCTSTAVHQALEITRAPMVWSHSSVAMAGKPSWQMVPWRARQLRLEDARAIAAAGGVVGLWTLRADVGATVQSFADRLIEMAELLGDDHVAFGTDMNAVSNAPISDYAGLRRALDHIARRGFDETRVTKIAIGNYARVLSAAMNARQA